MGLVFQHTGAATTRKFTKEHPDVFRRHVRSHAEAVHRIWTDQETSVKTLAKYMGHPTVLAEIGERDPRAKTGKPEQFVDFTFIKVLDQSGFIDGLYKKR